MVAWIGVVWVQHLRPSIWAEAWGEAGTPRGLPLHGGGHHRVRLGLVPAGKGGRWGPLPPLNLLSAADPSPPGPSTVEERVAQEALETLQLEKRLSLLSHAGRPGSGGGARGWPGLWDFS